MAIIQAVITRCNSLFKTEENFLFNSLLREFSFNNNKVTDININTEPFFIDYITDNKYFEDFDLSKGLNHYSTQLFISNSETAKAIMDSGNVFEVFNGVIIQLIFLEDSSENKNISPRNLKPLKQ